MLKIITRTLVLVCLFCTLGSMENAQAKVDFDNPLLTEDPGITSAMVHQLIKCSLDQFPNYAWPYTYSELADAYATGKLVIWHYTANLYMMEIDGVDICVALEF